MKTQVEYPMIVTKGKFVPFLPGDIVIQIAGVTSGNESWQAHFILGFLEGARSWSDSLRERVFPLMKFIIPCDWADGHILSSHFAATYEKSKAKNTACAQVDLLWESSHLAQAFRKNKGNMVIYGLFPFKELDVALVSSVDVAMLAAMAFYEESPNLYIGYQHDFPHIGTLKTKVDGLWPEEMRGNFFEVTTPFNFGEKIAQEFERSMLSR